jgi:hypothetical protein
MALDREQQAIVRQILRESRKIRDPKARRVFKRAAVQTGLVESGLRNLSYGDADSQGWRQERASLYPNPTNVKASVRRFRQEFEQHYQPGEKAWQVAGQVQRPAAQYLGRYKEVAPEARAILQGMRGQGGGALPGGGGGPTGYRTETRVNQGVRRDALLSYLDERGKPGALLSLARGLEGAVEQIEVPYGNAKSKGVSLGKGGGNAKPGGELLEMFHDPGINIDNGTRIGPIGNHDGHVHVAVSTPQAMKAVAKLALSMGLAVKENDKWDPVDPVHTDGSFHYRKFPGRKKLGMAVDVSGGDADTRLEFNRKVARMFS